MTRSCEEIAPLGMLTSVAGNANFGDDSIRDVLNETIIKSAFGYHSGFTALQIAYEMGLVKKIKSYRPELTSLGKEYLRSLLPINRVVGLARKQEPLS